MTKKLSILLAFFLASFNTNPQAGNLNSNNRNNPATLKQHHEKKIEINKKNIISGGDIKNRGLLDILHTFTPFPSLFSKLTQTCNVMDSGAGDCMLAREIFDDKGSLVKGVNIRGIFDSTYNAPIKSGISIYSEFKQEIINKANDVKRNKKNIRITSLTHTLPNNCPVDENHTIITGFFQDTSNKKILKKNGIGKFDVIIDSFGCIHNAVNDEERLQILERYSELLNDSGKIYIFSNTTLSDFIDFESENIKKLNMAIALKMISYSKKIALIEKLPVTCSDLEIIDASELDEDQ